MYAGHRSGNICVDLRFDADTRTPRATFIYFDRGQWSVGLKYLLYEAETNLDDSHLTQAFLTGEYSSLDLIITNLAAFLGLCFEVWINHTRLGLLIELTPVELDAYKAIDWRHWQPERLTVPSGTAFQIMRPGEWADRTLLIPVNP